ncbi:MAG: hypothetical protein KC421_12585, partial [Anaerolineales bacterium]|nr:hypothetical protein [Anaerolineales bacterium]
MMQSRLPAHKRPLLTETRPPLIAPGDLQFVLAVAFILGLRVLPASVRPRFLMQLSRFLGTLWHKSNMQDVRRVRQHVQQLFPNRWSATDIEAIVRQQLSLTVWNFMTLNLIPTLNREQSAQLLPVTGMEHLAALRAEKRPSLLLGAHIGPYAYPVAAVLMANEFQVHEVGHARPRQGSSWLYRKLYWPRIQATCRFMQVIDPLQGGQAELLDVIRSGKILFLLPDQLYVPAADAPRSRHLVQIAYLGHTVNLETGGLRLCKRLNTAVFTALPTFVHNRYHISIEPFTLPTTGLHPDDLAVDLQAFMDQVAQRIEAQPFLWRDLRRADL